MLYLCTRDLGEVVSRRDIADAMDIPPPFLGKVARQLARAGLIHISQGPRGGYQLLKPPHRLSLLDVVEAVMGEIYLNDCIVRPDTCKRSDHCAVHRAWETARERLRESLRLATFDHLLTGEVCMLPSTYIAEAKKAIG
jgi:Rrf2 family protein